MNCSCGERGGGRRGAHLSLVYGARCAPQTSVRVEKFQGTVSVKDFIVHMKSRGFANTGAQVSLERGHVHLVARAEALGKIYIVCLGFYCFLLHIRHNQL